MVREANKGDLNQLLRLYTHLHEEGIPDDEMKLEKVWSAILADMNHHIIVNEIKGRIVSSCVCEILIIEVTVMLQLVLNMQKKLLHLRIVTK